MFIKKIKLLFLFALLLHIQCKSQKAAEAYTSETLKIMPISENSFVHISYLNTNDFGKVACNGLLYIKNNEAIVFDTPTSNEVSDELLKWITEVKNADVKAIVVNHFHYDCLGGLDAFHKAKIPSYANNLTIDLARANKYTLPQIGFEVKNELEIGGEKIVNSYFGEAHTKDNIIHYIASEELIYGGCMIKSLNASKGNLEDANTNEWSITVQKIKDHYPNLKTIVPGHGAIGDSELLDYTIALFNAK
ncbi:subclass B1 metallo-beta-lactamase [Aurantibacter crassamenti]|uniref:subclass B1 metallo-beta-lactamase n=1 Tax=Aurantibacter crassamenti TaxID=1837375 RepID=UPI001939A1DD|nr:subclass B1 metallo-beta-lactamase [Aurantibacter crassamenti]MBM1108115.1 subclass B1 metallo-beta-lactamase [Aurantibacter crassamenti]